MTATLRVAATTRASDATDPSNRKQDLREGRSSLLHFSWLLGVVIAGIYSVTPVTGGEPVLLADPSAPLEQAWTHQRFRGETDYQRTKLDGVAAIRAVGRRSASGLYREVDYRIPEHPWLEWTWRVDRLQRTADIRVAEQEDFAAAIFLIFGRPDMFDQEVPTLVYVWTSDKIPEGAVVVSPHPSWLRAQHCRRER